MLESGYVVGLVDGEGSFIVNVNTHNRRRVKVELRFSLKLREQDRKMLYALKSFFGCGNVYVQNDKRVNHTKCYRFEVQKKKDVIERIIPFFEEHKPQLRSRRKDFELFKKVSEIIQTDNPDIGLVKSLKSKMHLGLAVYGKTVRAVGTPSSPEG